MLPTRGTQVISVIIERMKSIAAASRLRVRQAAARLRKLLRDHEASLNVCRILVGTKHFHGALADQFNFI